MTVAVRGRVPSKWSDNTARHITERLKALEKALSGGQDVFQAPSVPSFGSGSSTGGGGGTVPTTPGVTDHGALTGLQDDDHPQYTPNGVPTPVHMHRLEEILGIVDEIKRLVAILPHHPQNPAESNMVLAGQVFGG